MKDALTVVQSNDLLEASYNLTLSEARLIALAATKINSKYDKPELIEVTLEEFRRSFGIDWGMNCKNLREILASLEKKRIVMHNKDKGEIISIAWIPISVRKINYSNGESIKIKFAEEVQPLLYDLRGDFTSIEFEYASQLTSTFAFRLYQWLIQARNLKKYRVGKTIQFPLSIEEIVKRMHMSDFYIARWGKFKDEFFVPAIEQINAKTDLSVVWKPIKTGRKITEIQFCYVTEKSKSFNKKPSRPRLLRRPKVAKGSHEEGQWLRENKARLLKYKFELQEYDPKLKLNIKDLRRLIESYEALGETGAIYPDYHKLKKELKERSI